MPFSSLARARYRDFALRDALDDKVPLVTVDNDLVVVMLSTSQSRDERKVIHTFACPLDSVLISLRLANRRWRANHYPEYTTLAGGKIREDCHGGKRGACGAVSRGS